MGKIRFEFNSQGFHDLLCGPEVAGWVQDNCEEIAQRATGGLTSPQGDDFTVSTFVGNYGGGRTIGIVRANSWHARVAEATDKVLSKAVVG